MKVLTVVVLLTVCLMPASTQAQALWPDYAGKQACFGCHTAFKPVDLAEFNKSGHPWKVQPIDRSKVDANGVYKPFPAGTNEAGVPLAPEAMAMGFSYTASDSNIAFMIGGFGWKARWMNKQGYIYKGAKAQYNLGTNQPSQKGHGGYDASLVNNQMFALQSTPALYNCGSCHTTGWKAYNASTQPARYNNLPGFDGTFYEFGVQCEGCHGPSKNHVDNPTTIKPSKDGFTMCKSCHARSQGLKIAVKSDKQLLDHREQYDEMLFTKHLRTANMTCVTCHDPHKSTVYDRGGLKSTAKTCQPCHADKSNITITIVKDGSSTQAVHTCKDCHMPYTGNSAVKQNNNRGDQASHMWKINTNPVNKFQGMFTTDSLAVKIPADSVVAHTLDFACLGCHTTRDLNWASNYAKGIHAKNIVVNVGGNLELIPSAFYVDQNYPNPFNPSTTIRFGLPQNTTVRLVVYDINGKEVTVLARGNYAAGLHQAVWDGKDVSGESVASGSYVYRLETDHFIQAKKMVLTR